MREYTNLNIWVQLWTVYLAKETAEIEKRTAKGSKTLGPLKKLMNLKQFSHQAKLRLYRTVIRPTVIYGCENWIPNKAEENKLDVWKRKILRKIYEWEGGGGLK